MTSTPNSETALLATLESMAVGDSSFDLLSSKTTADCTAAVDRNRAAISAVAALIARNAELEAERVSLRALVGEWSAEAANLERAGVNAPYYDKGKASGFRQCADNLRDSLARTAAGEVGNG